MVSAGKITFYVSRSNGGICTIFEKESYVFHKQNIGFTAIRKVLLNRSISQSKLTKVLFGVEEKSLHMCNLLPLNGAHLNV